MELRNIEISDDAPEDVVQFVKHLEENLDPDDEFDSTVVIETVRLSEQDSMPASDITTRGPDPERAEWGVRVTADFVDNMDAPSRRVSELAESFYGYGEYTLQSSFDGGAGDYEAYVFETH